MKTLEELDEKSWYRLLKVLYIVLWLPYPLMLYVLATTSEGPVRACIIMTGLYILFCEGIRRAFYYVLIGTIFPNKRGSAQGCVTSEEQRTTSAIRKPSLIGRLRTILELKVVGHKDEEEAERFLRRRRRRNWAKAIIGCLIIIGSYIGIYEYFTGFSWKEYTFRSGDLLVSLPFEPKTEPPTSLQDEKLAHGETYKAGNETLNVTISYTELKPGYEFVIKNMLDYSLAALKEAKGIRVIGQRYEDFKINGYSAGKMIVDVVSDDVEATMEYAYVLTARDKCWYVFNAYPRAKSKSKEASDRIFNSMRIK
jgi:hypothetical protein